MNVKDYLRQGRLPDQRINDNLRRLREMRTGLDGICSPQINADKVQASPDGDPPYVKALMRISETEEHIDQEIDLLVDLRNQIDAVKAQLPRDVRLPGSADEAAPPGQKGQNDHFRSRRFCRLSDEDGKMIPERIKKEVVR